MIEYRGSRNPGAARVAMVIVNYNTAGEVISLYESTHRLRAARGKDILYIVVDNLSRPDEVVLLERYFAEKEDALLVLSEENGGYARGNNIGIREAARMGIEYCLIANSDIAFRTEDFVERLSQASRSLPACGLIGPRVVLPDGRPQGPLPELGILNGVIPTRIEEVTSTSVVYATVGCCIFGSTRAFQEAGLLDEETFLYREEVILAERLRRAGLNWYYLPEVEVLHNHRRKASSVGRLLLHKKHEIRSTVLYLRAYRRRSEAAILAYRMLFALKLGLYIALVAGRRAAGVIRNGASP
jgi:GT2 family glycosyltransferase